MTAHRSGRSGFRALLAFGTFLAAGAALIRRRFRQDMAAHAARIAADSLILETPCGRIEYGEEGSGVPILALHGAGGGYDQGLLLASWLGEGYRVIAPSRFGYLGSPILGDGSVQEQAAAYTGLLDALGLDRVAVFADSAGGPSALQFALDYPERVDALVLISAISTLRPIRDDSSGPPAALLTDFVFWSALTVLPDQALPAFGVPSEALARLTPAEHERMWETIRLMQPMSRRMPGMNLDAVEQSKPAVEALPLEQITAPTLVIHATDDSLIPVAQGQHSASRIPGARLVTVEYGGHLAAVLDSVTEQVKEFLSGIE
ncbi:MAG: alpha/beta hydrolase [Anaerolineae bacterium]|nr:alpha/beta hydrolase [Anaerolineae bacterium]